MSKACLNFCQFITLKDQDEINPEALWTQPKKPKKNITPRVKENNTTKQSKLLISAMAHIRVSRQKHESDAISDLQSLHSSNFMFSRQNTPVNYTFKKKNRHRTHGSELFDIQSQNQGKRDDNHQFDNLIINPHYLGLSELVYEQATGKQRKVSPKLIHSWKDCLTHEDRTQIYGDNVQYNFSRPFPINQLEKGFNEIYGSGKKRCLYIGQESILIHEMQRYLERCMIEPNKIARKDFDIISDIITNTKLLQLQNLPICMKQVELFWKILATFWRYSGKLNLEENKLLESALVNGYSNFIDLRKQTPITKFLLSESNISELQKN